MEKIFTSRKSVSKSDYCYESHTQIRTKLRAARQLGYPKRLFCTFIRLSQPSHDCSVLFPGFAKNGNAPYGLPHVDFG